MLQTEYNGFDITNLCDKLTATLKGLDASFKSCIVQVSMSDGYKDIFRRILGKLMHVFEI